MKLSLGWEVLEVTPELKYPREGQHLQMLCSKSYSATLRRRRLLCKLRSNTTFSQPKRSEKTPTLESRKSHIPDKTSMQSFTWRELQIKSQDKLEPAQETKARGYHKSEWVRTHPHPQKRFQDNFQQERGGDKLRSPWSSNLGNP